MRSPARALRLPRTVLSAMGVVHAAAPRQLYVAGTLQLLGGGLVAVQLLAGRAVVGHLVQGASRFEVADVAPPMMLAVAAGAVGVLIDQLRTDQQRVLGERTGIFVTDRVLATSSAADLEQFEDPAFHDRLRRAQLDAIVRPPEIASGLLGLCSSLAALGGVVVAIAAVGPVFLLAVALAAGPAALATNRASRLSYEFEVAQTAVDRERNYVLALLAGREHAKEIRAYDLAARFRRRYEALHRARIDALQRVASSRAVLLSLGALGSGGLVAGAVLLLLRSIERGSVSPASAIVAVGGLLLAAPRLSALALSATTIGESARFLDDLNTFLGSTPDHRPASVAGRRGPTTPRAVGPERLVVEDLWFRYPAGDDMALTAVDLVVEPGEVVALVGENGSGKSTLVKIVTGLYRVQRGRIGYGASDAAEVAPDEWRQHFSVVFQDFVRYFLTVEENIALGRPAGGTDGAAVARAAEQVGAADFIGRLPGGYAARLGPEFLGGTDLSGGEWQRLALARAVHRGAPFVALDEPSAALDPRAEAAMFQDIRRVLAGRSALLVSHRFSSVRSADRIYVLHRGAVEEHGTHDQLMARGGRYAELFTLQAAGYLQAPLI